MRILFSCFACETHAVYFETLFEALNLSATIAIVFRCVVKTNCVKSRFTIITLCIWHTGLSKPHIPSVELGILSGSSLFSTRPSVLVTSADSQKISSNVWENMVNRESVRILGVKYGAAVIGCISQYLMVMLAIFHSI